jgi:hypothetical protein
MSLTSERFWAKADAARSVVVLNRDITRPLTIDLEIRGALPIQYRSRKCTSLAPLQRTEIKAFSASEVCRPFHGPCEARTKVR